MDELKEYFEESKSHLELPDWDSLTEGQKKSVRLSMGFAAWKAAKAMHQLSTILNDLLNKGTIKKSYVSGRKAKR